MSLRGCQPAGQVGPLAHAQLLAQTCQGICNCEVLHAGKRGRSTHTPAGASWLDFMTSLAFRYDSACQGIPDIAQDDVHRSALAYSSDEALRASHAWDDAKVDLWLHSVE